MGFEPAPVDIGSVEAASVGDEEATFRLLDDGVPAADGPGIVGEPHGGAVRFGRAADSGGEAGDGDGFTLAEAGDDFEAGDGAAVRGPEDRLSADFGFLGIVGGEARGEADVSVVETLVGIQAHGDRPVHAIAAGPDVLGEGALELLDEHVGEPALFPVVHVPRGEGDEVVAGDEGGLADLPPALVGGARQL